MKKYLYKIIIMSLLVLFFACSKEIAYQSVIDQSPPRITSTSPANGSSGVSKFTKIVINFSEAINEGLVTPAVFSIIPPMPYTYSASGNQIIITPAGELPDGQRFWITINNTVKDISGNVLVNNYPFSFKIAGNNNSQAQTTFIVDNSTGRNYSMLYICGSWDVFGDYNSAWNDGTRYSMYDDGTHNDGVAGDGVWGYVFDISVDNFHQYKFGVDDDNDKNNGYVKDKGFFILSSAPKSETVYLYPPQPVTFNYFDTEGKVNSSIYLKGTFNDYANTHPMSGPFGGSRRFSVTLDLKEGNYVYKYYVDNDWDKVNPNDRNMTVTYGVTTSQNDYYEGGNTVVFNYYDIENKVTSDIFLKGDMNGWGDGNKMTGPEGSQRRFYTSVDVTAGNVYKYKYFADSDWDKVNLTNRYADISVGQTEVNDYYKGPLDTTFVYYDYEGKVTTSIHIYGEMNGWTISPAYQLNQDPVTNYKYTVTLELDQRSYEYKYYVDGDLNKVNVNNRTVIISSTNSRTIKDTYSGL